MLLGKQTSAPAGLEAARVEHRGKFAPPTCHRGDLVDAIVEESRERNVQSFPAHLALISEHIREVDVRVPKHEFVRERRVEHVCQACRNGI